MVTMNQIKQFGRSIGTEFNADKVILFGSYAAGTPTQHSDVDLLVVASFAGTSVDKSVQIRMKLRPKFPVDILVRTPEKIRQRLEMGDQFIKDIFHQGKVLYEADNH